MALLTWQVASNETLRNSLMRYLENFEMQTLAVDSIFKAMTLLGDHDFHIVIICPLVLGGEHSWLPPSAQPQADRWLLQEQRSLGDGEVLLRYQRKGNS